MEIAMRLLKALFVFAVLVSGAVAQEVAHEDTAHKASGHEQWGDIIYHPDEPHHFSVVIAGTNIPSANETAFTIGVDYEYRINRRWGVGFVAEQAFGEIDSTTLLAVTDIHLWGGLALQIGPGVEFVDEGEQHETFAIGRIGALYELEFGDRFTISPQLHYDISSGEDAIVFGFAIGRAF